MDRGLKRVPNLKPIKVSAKKAHRGFDAAFNREVTVTGSTVTILPHPAQVVVREWGLDGDGLDALKKRVAIEL